MNYDVDYFINKFKSIPENKIIANTQDDGKGGHCSLGWCKNSKGEYGHAAPNHKKFEKCHSIEAEKLRDLFISAGIRYGDEYREKFGWGIAHINNGSHPDYQQPTPKQRILAALYDVKRLQQDKSGDKAVEEANEIISNPVEEPEMV